jgi:hypothetical protein
LDIDEQEALAEEPAKAPAAEVAPAKPEPAKSPKSEDWLSGHLDLLSKLK